MLRALPIEHRSTFGTARSVVTRHGVTNVTTLSPTSQNQERGTSDFNAANNGRVESDPGGFLPAAFLHDLSHTHRLLFLMVYQFPCRELLPPPGRDFFPLF